MVRKKCESFIIQLFQSIEYGQDAENIKRHMFKIKPQFISIQFMCNMQTGNLQPNS